MKLLLSILFFSFLSTTIFDSQETSFSEEWILKKNSKGMLVYTRANSNSNLKELKIVYTLSNTNLSKILSVLGETQKYPDWLYGCSKANEMYRKNELESYDYYRMDFPWPLSDRELYTYGTYQQDPISKILTIETKGNQKYAKPNKRYVNITEHYNKWILEPLNKTQVKITYFLKSNPGGNIPTWVVNMAIDYGPLKTMVALQKKVKQLKSANKNLTWIEEY